MTTNSKINNSKKRWRDVRKRAATKIDPATAVLGWRYGQVMDPYGLREYIPPEYDCIDRVYFARGPRSKVWVWVGDLPQAAKIAFCFRRLRNRGEWLRKTPPITGACGFGEKA
ncbi:hypothetical protein RA307_15175 [Xanthobacteraceae bacterium Astr-EGSB]|uniref:hypothetical protein n=1 Tax=Astrobacterium formosum TaxID=3069710 RepID=UPI0027AE411F|nr:hypothetical protein [Xanthobacteraceae bacterium Astr-EGSB]